MDGNMITSAQIQTKRKVAGLAMQHYDDLSGRGPAMVRKTGLLELEKIWL